MDSHSAAHNSCDHGNKGKKIHEGEMEEREERPSGEIAGRDAMERYVDCKRKKISLSLLSSVDNQSFLSALE